MTPDESPIRAWRFSVTFDDLFHVPSSWMSWSCRIYRSRVDPGYVNGACRYDHDCDSWEQLARETGEHLARWHPHVRGLGAVPGTGEQP